ncbi:MAG: DUF3592 domain-containing protein [Anaerolineae bacterium]|nr:DUF3592 domain-containing protein [Anaerolineae bacterium]
MHKYKFIISLLLLGYGSYILYQRLSFNLQAVPAVVTQSHKDYIKSQPDRPGRYYSTFEYQYTYLDRTYRSDQYRYGGRDMSVAVCRYQVDDSLTAYVNPNNPGYAVINRHISGFVYALTGIGGLMLVQTIMMYVLDNQQENAHRS